MRLHANLQAGASEVEGANRRKRKRHEAAAKRKNLRTLSSSFRCVTREEREVLRRQHASAGVRR